MSQTLDLTVNKLTSHPSGSVSECLQHVTVGALVGPGVEEGRRRGARHRPPGPPGVVVYPHLLLRLGTGLFSCVPVQRVVTSTLAATDHSSASSLVHQVRARWSRVGQVVSANPGRRRAHRWRWRREETLQASLWKERKKRGFITAVVIIFKKLCRVLRDSPLHFLWMILKKCCPDHCSH